MDIINNFTDKDVTAACNLIMRQRKSSRRNKCKGISVPLFKEDNYLISTNMSCTYTYNGAVSYSHCIRYCGCNIYPTTNNKLKCINKAGLLNLKKNRLATSKWRYNRKLLLNK